ncbi:hypothetical protein RCOM_1724280 [Ricinus communis]|uniref:RNase H type-1 domain-containing protein n=1 Tax=Ricinus communis TaxID=3988 RepID=B9RSJ8_RICCO|nr:hypothetical protein RCOM_1724280 [Ricinus communis]
MVMAKASCLASANTSLEPESTVCLYGLRLAWLSGHKQVLMEVDNQLVVDVLSEKVAPSRQYLSLHSEIVKMLGWNWIVRINHSFREANRCADCLANTGHSFALGYHVLQAPPDQVVQLLFQDNVGTSFPRIFLLMLSRLV